MTLPDADPQLALLRSGDEAAFAGLFVQFKDRVYNTALGYVQRKEDAEEIVQDVFVEVFQSVGNFRADATLSTWIYRITINKSLDLIKARKSRKRFAFLTSLFHPETEELVTDPPDFHHPGVVLENKEKAALLFKAIDQLPERQRSAFILAKVEGLPQAEIGAVLELSVSAVEALLQRAQANLRKQLGTYYKNR